MKHTIVVCSSNRPIQDETRKAIDRLRVAGAQLILQVGSPDVAYSRNIALTGVLRFVATRNKAAAAPKQSSFALQYDPGGCAEPPPAIDTVLMVDDDMMFTLEEAQALVTHSRAHNVGASAMYATVGGTLAATRLYTPPGETQRWLVGLGLLALPFAELQAVAKRSETFEAYGQEHVEFCWTAAYKGQWQAEDYSLCRRFGGVHLLPIAAGHLKTVPIYPDAETVRRIAENERLPSNIEMQRIEDPAMVAALRAKEA